MPGILFRYIRVIQFAPKYFNKEQLKSNYKLGGTILSDFVILGEKLFEKNGSSVNKKLDLIIKTPK